MIKLNLQCLRWNSILSSHSVVPQDRQESHVARQKGAGSSLLKQKGDAVPAWVTTSHRSCVFYVGPDLQGTAAAIAALTWQLCKGQIHLLFQQLLGTATLWCSVCSSSIKLQTLNVSKQDCYKLNGVKVFMFFS